MEFMSRNIKPIVEKKDRTASCGVLYQCTIAVLYSLQSDDEMHAGDPRLAAFYMYRALSGTGVLIIMQDKKTRFQDPGRRSTQSYSGPT